MLHDSEIGAAAELFRDIRTRPTFLYPDQEQIREARDYLRSEGLYGSVSVAHWQSNRLPFADNLVNLIVSEETSGIAMDEIMRVLTPKGVAYPKKAREWTTTVKSWPKEIDEWTHLLHDSSNNAVAEDTRVGPPRVPGQSRRSRSPTSTS